MSKCDVSITRYPELIESRAAMFYSFTFLFVYLIKVWAQNIFLYSPVN